MSGSPFMTPKQVAMHFKRKTRTIYRWLEEGKFPGAFKVANGLFIPVADVEALAEGQQE